MDQAFDYSATPDADPRLVKVTLTEHLEALKKAGEEVDFHIKNRNLSAALVATTVNIHYSTLLCSNLFASYCFVLFTSVSSGVLTMTISTTTDIL